MATQKLRVQILPDDCIGDGACCDDAPGTFKMTREGYACVKEIVTDDPETILRAARACPTDAIVVVDDETGEQIVP